MVSACQSYAQSFEFMGITTSLADQALVDRQIEVGDPSKNACSRVMELHGFNSPGETEEYGWSMGVPGGVAGGATFKATNIHTNSLADLRGGGTYRYIMGWSPGINRGSTEATPGDNGNQVLQLGLINPSTFAGSQFFDNTDSFYLTGYETFWARDEDGATYTSQFLDPEDPDYYPPGSEVPVGILTLNLRLSDENESTLADLGTVEFKYTSSYHSQQIIFYLFDMEFGLNEDGAFTFNVAVGEYFQFLNSDIENG